MVVYCFDYFVAVIVVTVDVTFGSGKAVFVSFDTSFKQFDANNVP